MTIAQDHSLGMINLFSNATLIEQERSRRTSGLDLFDLRVLFEIRTQIELFRP
jgi:hypothetical protein